jgi:hypothetical protein
MVLFFSKIGFLKAKQSVTEEELCLSSCIWKKGLKSAIKFGHA